MKTVLAGGLLASLTAVSSLSAPLAAVGRVDSYTILMDGDPIGQEQVRIEPQGDTTKVAVTASTRVKVLFINFRYDHQREETWRAGTLVSMTARTDDDGTPHTIAMTRQGDAYAVSVDGKDGREPGAALPLTLWTPDVLKHPVLLSVIDAHPYTVRVQAIGLEQVGLGGRTVEARHHRITGDVERDVWFAADGTLVKLQFRRSGYDIVYLLK